MTRFGTCMSVSVPRHARRFALAITPFQKQCRAIPTRTTLQPCVNFARAAFPASRSASSTPVRSPLYAQIEERDVRFFEEILGKGGVITDVDDLVPYNTDWMKKYQGQSKLALRPKSTEQVSQIMKYCNERCLAVVPQGGNTGLVGGSIPIFDEIVLSLSNMNSIISFDARSGVVVCEAGHILQNLESYVNKKGFMVPLDLGAKGTCQIGGNVATNAGGLRLIRYGSLKGSVLGIEAVLADGTVLDTLNTLRKDNTGYDVKQLFIGSEGSLGVITKVAIATPRKPNSVQVVVVGCESFAHVLDTVSLAQSSLSEIISAIEFFDKECLGLLLSEKMQGCRDPMPDTHPFYILLETSGSNADHDKAKLMTFLEDAMSQSCVLDGVVAQDGAQVEALWKLREKIPLALGSRGRVFKYDLSVPMAEMYTLCDDLRERLKPYAEAEVFGYGHLGDGNLHLNVTCPVDLACKGDGVLALIEPYVYEWTAQRRGSVSAEHGIGQFKTGQLHLSKSAPAIDLMRHVKRIMDPNNILNPYKVLPSSAADS
mmetsp:Transcript_90242/g.145935  ORF Transcript_90242/g.145935 Transcript_90242/m.145935 type:complete len:541 (+) Transcript_90242:82-1704(+)